MCEHCTKDAQSYSQKRKLEHVGDALYVLCPCGFSVRLERGRHVACPMKDCNRTFNERGELVDDD